jgi:hypothetical protein
MTPKIATEIIARDKTASGFAAAEQRAKGFASKTRGHIEKSGLATVGKQLDGLSKLRGVDFSGGRLGTSLQQIARSTSDVASGFQAAGEKVAGFGAMGEDAISGFGGAIAMTALRLASLGTVIAGLGAGVYMFGDKYAKSAAELDRSSKTIGMAAQDLQGLRAAGEQAGISADAATAGIDGFARSLYDLRSGRNNAGVGVLERYGKALKYTKEGAVDTTQALYDLADIVSLQKDPQVQRAVAEQFGAGALLPLLRQGSAAIRAKSKDFTGSFAAYSDQQISEGAATAEQSTRFKQRLAGLEKVAGVADMGITSRLAKSGIAALDLGSRLVDPAKHPKKPGFLDDPLGALKNGALEIEHSAEDLAHRGLEAGRHLIEGGERAAQAIVGAARASGGRGGLPQQATAFFQALGYTPAQARGMTAGAYAESGLNPTAVNPKSGAFGIGQWLGSRKAELFKRYGTNPSFDDQLAFMGWELLHSERRAGSAIAQTDEASDAMETYVRRFMRPAPGAETSGDIARGGKFLGAPAAAGAKTQVEITLKGAPAGTVTRVTPAADADVSMAVTRGMDGP